MQTVEDFLAEYFQVRSELILESHRRWKPHAERFFVSGYDPWGYRETETEDASEKILSVTFKEDEAEILTTGPIPSPVRTRYKIRAAEGSWRIGSIELECVRCRGSGKSKESRDCGRCNGKGWRIIGKKQT
jgi:hypothetical protein